MQILDRYVLRLFFTALAVVLCFLLGMFLAIDAVSRVDSVLEARSLLREHGFSVGGVLAWYYLVSIPFFLLQLVPFATLLAATIAVIRLTRGNELTAMIAAGRGRLRIAAPMLAFGLVAAVAMLALQEWAVPALAEIRLRVDRITRGDFEGRVDDLPPLHDGLGNTWRVEEYRGASRTLAGIQVIRLREAGTGRVLGTLAAESATWEEAGPRGPGWYPRGGSLQPAEGTEGFGVVRPLPEDEPLPTDIRPAEIELLAARNSREAGRMLSLSEAAELVRLYPGIPGQAVAFHGLLTWPLANLLLLAVGLPFLLRPGKRSVFFGLGIALVLCAAFFAADRICADLGNRSSLPPVVAAWLPVVLFGSFALALNDRLR